MAEIIVIETSKKEDLTTFSRYLWEQKVPHKIVNKNNKQQLLVGSTQDAEQVAVAYEKQHQGDALPTITRADDKTILNSGLRLLKTPVTTLFVVLSIVGYLLTHFDTKYELVGWLTFFKLEIVGNRATLSLESGEYWRLFTPVFLHFTLLHVVFNSLWLWELGGRFEYMKGGVKLLGLIFILGMGSNLAQYWYVGPSIFGGMSGVIYGLLGYCWVWSYLKPEYSMQIPISVVYFMLAWFVLYMFDFSAALGLGSEGNAAHLGGLVMGAVLGASAAFIHKHKS